MIREQSQCFQFYYEFLDQGPLCVEQHSDTKIIVVLKRSSLEQTKTPSLFIGWGGGEDAPAVQFLCHKPTYAIKFCY